MGTLSMMSRTFTDIRDGWMIKHTTVTEAGKPPCQTLRCRLWPVGRSSVEDDWRKLGEIVRFYGAPEEPVTPIETTPANDWHVWEWESALTVSR